MKSTASFAIDNYFEDQIVILNDGMGMKMDKTLDIVKIDDDACIMKSPNAKLDTEQNLQIDKFKIEIPKTGYWNTKSGSKKINGPQWI
jgi:hypothetical protein